MAEHDVVLVVAAELGVVGLVGQKLDVAAAAVRVLVVLHLGGELDYEGLALGRGHLGHLARDRVEAHVLRAREALVRLLIHEPLAARDRKLAHLLAGRRARLPARLPVAAEVLLEVDLGRDGRKHQREHRENLHPEA